MGNTSSEFYSTQLSPIPQERKLVLFSDKYCSSEIQVMNIIEEFSWSGENFEVCDQGGKRLFFMDGKHFTQCKKLHDAKGNIIGRIEHKFWSLHRQLNVFNNNGDLIAVVRKETLMEITPNVFCWIKQPHEKDLPNIERTPDISMIGNWRTKQLVFVNANQENIAKVQRQSLKVRNYLGKQTYECRVSENTDYAFIVMLTVCLDEIFHENHHHRH